MGIHKLVEPANKRQFSVAPQSMIKLRFKSLVVPETQAKESKIRLTLVGFTFTLYSDLEWVSDLTAFSKSPPGVSKSTIFRIPTIFRTAI